MVVAEKVDQAKVSPEEVVPLITPDYGKYMGFLVLVTKGRF